MVSEALKLMYEHAVSGIQPLYVFLVLQYSKYSSVCYTEWSIDYKWTREDYNNPNILNLPLMDWIEYDLPPNIILEHVERKFSKSNEYIEQLDHLHVAEIKEWI